MNRVRLMIFLWGLLLTTACTEKKYMYSDPTDIAMFSLETESFVAVNGAEDNVKELFIASPVTAEVNRTYLVQVITKGSDEEAEAEMQYELASSAVVSIPAGELTGSFKVRVFPQALSEGVNKVAYFSLTAVDPAHPVATFKNSMSLMMSATCMFSPEELPGNFNITTTLIDAGTYGNIIYKVPIEADPKVENGFIIKSPYAEGVDLHMKMWPMESGEWEVEIEDTFLYRSEAVEEENILYEAYDVYGFGRGVWRPCAENIYISWYLHFKDDEEIQEVRTDIFNKNIY